MNSHNGNQLNFDVTVPDLGPVNRVSLTTGQPTWGVGRVGKFAERLTITGVS